MKFHSFGVVTAAEFEFPACNLVWSEPGVTPAVSLQLMTSSKRQPLGYLVDALLRFNAGSLWQRITVRLRPLVAENQHCISAETSFGFKNPNPFANTKL